MKKGICLFLRDKKFFYSDNCLVEHSLSSFTAKFSFLYIVDKNRDARNFDIYCNLASLIPFIVETHALSLIKRLNDLHAPILSSHFSACSVPCFSPRLHKDVSLIKLAKYVILKEKTSLTHFFTGKKVIIFESVPFPNPYALVLTNVR